MSDRQPSRREFLRIAGGTGLALAGGGGLVSILDACGGKAATAPTPLGPADVSKLHDAARKEGKLAWWTGQFELTQAQDIIKAFKEKFPGVDVELLRQTSQVVFQRTAQDFRAGANTVDVVGTADEANFVELKKMGALASYKPPDVDLLPKQFQNIDKDGTYYTSALGLVVVNYSSRLVTDPPKQWKDLLDPKWKGKITLGHPGFSGYVGSWVTAITQKYGWGYFQDLAKQNPKIGRSINDTVADLVPGERQVGAGSHAVTQASKAKGNPVDSRPPDDFTVLIVGPSAVLKNAPHQNAARLFQNFAFSKEYSQAMAETFQPSIRTDVSNKAGLNLDKMKLVRVDVESLTKQLPDLTIKWRETMGV
jgi:iron(III) transport system substrate-binding protein